MVEATWRAVETFLDQWAGFNYLKIRSGISGTPVNQSGAVTILLTVRDA